jgi:hypothetical protein
MIAGICLLVFSFFVLKQKGTKKFKAAEKRLKFAPLRYGEKAIPQH